MRISKMSCRITVLEQEPEEQGLVEWDDQEETEEELEDEGSRWEN